MLDEQQRQTGPQFHWKCPIRLCDYKVNSYTEGGLRSFKAFHQEKHDKEIKLNTLKFDTEMRRRIVNYDKLVLTLHDINMFEQHQIQIDEGCVIDGYSS